jgi:hypothetical protein
MPLFLADASGYDAQRSDQGRFFATDAFPITPTLQSRGVVAHGARITNDKIARLAYGRHWPCLASSKLDGKMMLSFFDLGGDFECQVPLRFSFSCPRI